MKDYVKRKKKELHEATRKMRESISGFIRLNENSIETAVKIFTKEGIMVVFASNIHKGSLEYFTALIQALKNCDCVLYEGLGKDGDKLPEELQPYGALFDIWNSLHYQPVPSKNHISSKQALESKKTHQWKRCDIWFSQFLRELQKKLPTKENIEKYIIHLYNKHLNEKYYLPTDNERYLQLLQTSYRNDPIGEILIKIRDIYLINSINQEIENGVKHIGVFYGANHGPNVERYLLDENFLISKVKWVPISEKTNK
ncbi:MAG: hypothetical protein ACW97X_09815 [Candidatus Hodarchaeales archaeon]